MDIQHVRVTIRVQRLERSVRFYGQVLSLPEIDSWEREDSCGVRFQIAGGSLELLGRPDAGSPSRDEAFDYQGPDQKMTLTFMVESAEQAYKELIARDRNILGGLRQDASGALVFETHDPDGVKIMYQESN